MRSFIEHLPYAPLLFAVFFVTLWVCVSFAISRMGWHSFAERYPAENKPVGAAYRSPFSWFRIILASYRNVVRVVFTEAGIYFSVMFLFRPFHRPFLVPWASVKRIEKKDFLFLSRFRMDIQDSCGEIHVMLPVKVEPEVCKYYPLSSREHT